jgi:hypothetical protein
MRAIVLLPLVLAACAGPSQSGTAVYLYPGSKAEIVKDGACAVHENVSTDVLAPASMDVTTWLAEDTRKDQAGHDLVKVSPCGK